MTDFGNMSMEDALEHFGTKGMKWGVRKATRFQAQADAFKAQADRNPTEHNKAAADHTQKLADRKWAKVDGKWEKSIYTMKGAIAVHNNIADKMNGPNGMLNDLNNRPHFKGKEPLNDPKLSKRYIKEYEDLANRAYTQSVKDIHGSSPSGKKEAVYVRDDLLGDRIEVRDKNVQHADDEGFDSDLVLMLNTFKGFVISTNTASTSLAHADSDDDILAHFGTKGMKWGVRKAASAGSAIVGHTPDSSGMTRRDLSKIKRKLNTKANDHLDDFLALPGKARDSQIHISRASLVKANRNYRDAKQTYKAEKITKGKNAAKVALVKAKHVKYNTEFKAEHKTQNEIVGEAIARIFDNAFASR